MAKEKEVDLALIIGTGPKGRITLEDVEAYLAGPKVVEPVAEVKTSPMAAKLAAELGVDVSQMNVQGRVMKAEAESRGSESDAGGHRPLPGGHDYKNLCAYSG